MSIIHYKFKSAKDYSSISFEGLSISLFELKRDILVANKLKGSDFDLILSNAQTDEDYQDDNQLIPKNTSVYVRRVPARPGSTNAQHYLANDSSATIPAVKPGDPRTDINNFAIGATTNHKQDNNVNIVNSVYDEINELPLSLGGVLPGESEEDKLRALFDQTSFQWDQQNQNLSANRAIGGANANNRIGAPLGRPSATSNYICHRCGVKGHFVQNCPSSERKNTVSKVKRTTGIPRSFLRNVESVPDGKGAMITNDGALVVAQTNDTAWKRIQLNQRGSGVSMEELRETAPIPAKLACNLCTLLLTNAVSIPCCSKLFCLECIMNKLLETQFQCPSCHADGIVPDRIVTELQVRSRVEEHLRLWATERSGIDTPTQVEEFKESTNENAASEKSKYKDAEEDQEEEEFIRPRRIISVVDSRDKQDRYHRNNYRKHQPSAIKQVIQPIINDFNPIHQTALVAPEVPIEELPPLRWTSDGGISGHINLPPIDNLEHHDEYSNIKRSSSYRESSRKRHYRSRSSSASSRRMSSNESGTNERARSRSLEEHTKSRSPKTHHSMDGDCSENERHSTRHSSRHSIRSDSKSTSSKHSAAMRSRQLSRLRNPQSPPIRSDKNRKRYSSIKKSELSNSRHSRGRSRSPSIESSDDKSKICHNNNVRSSERAKLRQGRSRSPSRRLDDDSRRQNNRKKNERPDSRQERNRSRSSTRTLDEAPKRRSNRKNDSSDSRQDRERDQSKSSSRKSHEDSKHHSGKRKYSSSNSRRDRSRSPAATFTKQHSKSHKSQHHRHSKREGSSRPVDSSQQRDRSRSSSISSHYKHRTHSSRSKRRSRSRSRSPRTTKLRSRSPPSNRHHSTSRPSTSSSRSKKRN